MSRARQRSWSTCGGGSGRARATLRWGSCKMHTLGRDKTWRWVQRVWAWWWELLVEGLVAAMWDRLQDVRMSQGRAEQGCLRS